jgi:FMN-dependent NADH-azoreductase
MNILQITSSIYGSGGQSSQLTERFTARLALVNRSTVTVRDLAREPIPHLDAARFGAFMAKPEDRTAEQATIVAYSDELIGELKNADVIVLGLPMYNFGVPSMLKAYFDHVARAGVTFRYTPNGPVGLLSGKRAYVFAARGGQYAGTPRDSQTPYVRDFLAFLGIKDVRFMHAEGLNMGPAIKQAALTRVHGEIEQLVLASAVAQAA